MASAKGNAHKDMLTNRMYLHTHKGGGGGADTFNYTAHTLTEREREPCWAVRHKRGGINKQRPGLRTTTAAAQEAAVCCIWLEAKDNM